MILTDVRGCVLGVNAQVTELLPKESFTKDNCAIANIPSLTWFYFSRSSGPQFRNGGSAKLLSQLDSYHRDGQNGGSIPYESYLIPQLLTRHETLNDFNALMFHIGPGLSKLGFIEGLVDEVYAEPEDQQNNTQHLEVKYKQSDKASSASSLLRFNKESPPYKLKSRSKVDFASLQDLAIISRPKVHRPKLELFLKSLKDLYIVSLSAEPYYYQNGAALCLIKVKQAHMVSSQFKYFFEKSVSKEPLILIEPILSFVLNECRPCCDNLRSKNSHQRLAAGGSSEGSLQGS